MNAAGCAGCQRPPRGMASLLACRSVHCSMRTVWHCTATPLPVAVLRCPEGWLEGTSTPQIQHPQGGGGVAHPHKTGRKSVKRFSGLVHVWSGLTHSAPHSSAAPSGVGSRRVNRAPGWRPNPALNNLCNPCLSPGRCSCNHGAANPQVTIPCRTHGQCAPEQRKRRW